MARGAARLSAPLLGCLLLAGCGAAGPGAPPAPPAGGASTSSRAAPSLRWRQGEQVALRVSQQVTTHTSLDGAGGTPLTLQVAVTARQSLTVASLPGGAADLVVRTTSWAWQLAGASRAAAGQPPPSRLRVAADGAILSGRLWSMPQDPPVPAADLFSAGLPPPGTPPGVPWSASWPRTLPDGTPVDCQAQGGGLQPAGAGSTERTAVHCRLTMHTTTPDAGTELVQGDVKALVDSTFDLGRGRVLETSYASSFAERETTSQGSTSTDGSVTATIGFSY